MARASQPYIEQIFVGCAPGMDPDALERKLYVVRKRAEAEVAATEPAGQGRCSTFPRSPPAPSFTRACCWRRRSPIFISELSDPDVMSALCLVHQRFSTNTFPTWQLAHPYRYVAHNGEINTVRGNVNWMHARQSILASPLFGDDIKKLFPIIAPGGSDSASFDNALELLLLAGRACPTPWPC